MGASFQAPHAAPRQRQMEMHHDSLIIVFIFQYASSTRSLRYVHGLQHIIKTIIIIINNDDAS